jgi:NADPH-dependent 2,4-dienoyl-CoA reductase/sulfur reductase-like enzyme
MNQILIIGGSDAGISAGLRAREVAPDADVTVLVKDEFPNFSICGLPFYIGGEVEDWPHLAHRTHDDLQEAGLRILVRHEAIQIHPEAHTVVARNASVSSGEFSYDRLIVATGAASARPPIPGCDLPGVFFMRFMGDGLAVRDYLEKFRPSRAALIGTGYIGMEMADALHRRGMAVTLLEMADSVMPSFDAEMGALLQKALMAQGIRVKTGVKITEIEKQAGALIVRAGDETAAEADFILIAAGAKPCVDLAVEAGIALGKSGAIAVNEKMETSLPDVYAAGDCAETLHRLTGKYGYMPLGTTSHKQGRVAGENATGGNAVFKGVVGTQSLKVFDRIAARTGFRSMEAREHGFDPLSVDMETPDHKAYYPGSSPIHIRLTGDRDTGRLLGGQIMGRHGAEISKRIDIIATALFSEITISDFVHLDLSYTPPLSSPWDPLQMAAFKWLTDSKR